MRVRHDRPELQAILDRLRFVLSEPVDFRAPDTANTIAKVRLLTAAATCFNVLSIDDFGGRGGPKRGEGLLENAVGATFQSLLDPDDTKRLCVRVSAGELRDTSVIAAELRRLWQIAP